MELVSSEDTLFEYLIELACSINTKDCDAPKMRETVQDTAINFHGKSRRGFGLNR